MSASAVCNNTAIRKATRRVTLLYDNALGDAGIRSTQFTILAAIDEASVPPTIRELAANLVMEASALGHNLRPLEREGWVKLSAPDTDRRSKRLTLTPDGVAKLREGEALWQAAQTRFEKVLGKKAAAALRAALLEIANDDRLVTLD
ncbi:MAG: winged helix DNA-binding protein [Caulobacteraceae bacterium]